MLLKGYGKETNPTRKSMFLKMLTIISIKTNDNKSEDFEKIFVDFYENK